MYLSPDKKERLMKKYKLLLASMFALLMTSCVNDLYHDLGKAINDEMVNKGASSYEVTGKMNGDDIDYRYASFIDAGPCGECSLSPDFKFNLYVKMPRRNDSTDFFFMIEMRLSEIPKAGMVYQAQPIPLDRESAVGWESGVSPDFIGVTASYLPRPHQVCDTSSVDKTIRKGIMPMIPVEMRDASVRFDKITDGKNDNYRKIELTFNGDMTFAAKIAPEIKKEVSLRDCRITIYNAKVYDKYPYSDVIWTSPLGFVADFYPHR